MAYTAVAIDDADAHDATAVGIPAVEHANVDAHADGIRETANDEDSPIVMDNNNHKEMPSALATTRAANSNAVLEATVVAIVLAETRDATAVGIAAGEHAKAITRPAAVANLDAVLEDATAVAS